DAIISKALAALLRAGSIRIRRGIRRIGLRQVGDKQDVLIGFVSGSVFIKIDGAAGALHQVGQEAIAGVSIVAHVVDAVNSAITIVLIGLVVLELGHHTEVTVAGFTQHGGPRSRAIVTAHGQDAFFFA